MYFRHFPAIVAVLSLVAALPPKTLSDVTTALGPEATTTEATTATTTAASTATSTATTTAASTATSTAATTAANTATTTAASTATSTATTASTSTAAFGVTSSTLGFNANTTLQTTTYSGTVNIHIGFLCILPVLMISMATLF